jgi:4-hydroxy-tetrahydrodipicolinate reductase
LHEWKELHVKIGLVGKGNMGRAIAAYIPATAHTIAAQFDSTHPVTPEALHGCDVVLDFSTPHALAEIVECAGDAGVPLVTGTTGWNHDRQRIEARVEAKKSAFLWGANFSVGTLLFARLVRRCGELFARMEGYDIALHEIHHNRKLDSPSGTARLLAETLMEVVPRKSRVQAGNVEGRIATETLHISSSRVGSVPGTHHVYVEGAEDSIELIHRARGRGCFARGAIAATEWLPGRRGFFTVDDMIDDILGQTLQEER